MEGVTNMAFSGKMEERAVFVSVADGATADIEFGDFKATLILRILNPEADKLGLIKVNFAVKPVADLKIGLAIHLKVPSRVTDEYDTLPAEYHSSSTSVLALSAAPCDVRILEFDDTLTYYCPPEKLEVRVKAFWAEHRPVYCEVVNKKANIEINGELIEVDCQNLSACSDYFSGYFRSNWQEAVDNRYVVKDCTIAEFADLLAVIHPYAGKPIDSNNVESLLEMARKWFIPSVTHKCECFLIERMHRKENMVENIELAENFGLEFARELLLAAFGDAAKFRLLLNDDKFAGLPDHLKIRIHEKYVEVDLKNNASPMESMEQ